MTIKLKNVKELASLFLSRLIKGDGEVLEEIVSRDRHKQINQQATKGDAEYFQNRISEKVKK